MSIYTVRPYTSHDWTHIVPLVDAWPFKPLGGHADWRSTDIRKLTYERLQSVMGRQDGESWVALQDKAVRGFAVLSQLMWDSEQLGLSAARVEHLSATGSYTEQHRIKETLLNQVLDEAQRRGVRYLQARVDASDLSGLHVLEEAGFITVDGILTYAKEPARHEPAPPSHNFRIRLATSDDATSAADLARTAFSYDRFHSDPSVKPERADELHAAWVRNSCEGRAADAVLLAEDEEGLLGFVTCKLQQDTSKHLGRMVGTIVLVAIVVRARGMGVGQAITMAALEWFRAQGTAIVEVGTQLRNIPAARLYQKCGFALVGSSVSFRRLL